MISVILAALGLLATAGGIIWALSASWSLEDRDEMGLFSGSPDGTGSVTSSRTRAKADSSAESNEVGAPPAMPEARPGRSL